MTNEDNDIPQDVIKITKAILRSNEEIEVAEGLTVIVGPNNAGKSQLLREIVERFNGNQASAHYRPKSLESAHFEERCSAQELVSWIRSKHRSFKPGQYNHGSYIEESFSRPGNSQSMPVSQIRSSWGQHRPGYQEIAPYLISYFPPGQASGSISNSAIFHVGREAPTTPLQMLYLDRALEQSISNEMHTAFGERLVLHRHAGSQISLHVGEILAPEGHPPASTDYLNEIESLPLLQEQGDGVRSYIGMVLNIITASYPILIIDEPEAFLHPPQAHMLGQFLARQNNSGTQVIVATHSSDIMRGIVSVASSRSSVTVVRLTRSSAGNHAAQVPINQVQRLYEDPLIKYFGILDGLFFHGVILCEADSDCTYYRAVLETTVETLKDGRPASALNLHFAHCGGKTRIPKAVQALRAARVPVACAVDIDYLQNDKDFVDLVTACGGKVEDFTGHRNVILAAIRSQADKVERSIARFKVDEVLNGSQETHLTSGECDRIKQAVSANSGWKFFKKVGSGLLAGGTLEAFETLDGMLREIGIFLVALGELECFHKQVPNTNKAHWLRTVLENELYKQSPPATEYVSRMANFVWQHQDQSATREGKMVGGSS